MSYIDEITADGVTYDIRDTTAVIDATISGGLDTPGMLTLTGGVTVSDILALVASGVNPVLRLTSTTTGEVCNMALATKSVFNQTTDLLFIAPDIVNGILGYRAANLDMTPGSEDYTRYAGAVPSGAIPEPLEGDAGQVLVTDGQGGRSWGEPTGFIAEPENDGTAGQVLTTNGSGVRTWTSKGPAVNAGSVEAYLASITTTGDDVTLDDIEINDMAVGPGAVLQVTTGDGYILNLYCTADRGDGYTFSCVLDDAAYVAEQHPALISGQTATLKIKRIPF